MNATYTRVDGQITHGRNYKLGRFVVSAAWLPPKLYTRAEISYQRDARHGDGAVTVTVGRVSAGWYWGSKS